jgi:tetratricopeptide (TPR) repeat protein
MKFASVLSRVMFCCPGRIVPMVIRSVALITVVLAWTGTAILLPADEQIVDEKPEADDEKIEGLQEPLNVRDESSQLDPSNKDALAWYMTGQKAMKRGDLQAAAEAFQKSADADEKSAVPVRALALVLFRQGKIEEGLDKARRAIEMDPNDYQTRLELAVLFGSNRRFVEAAGLLESALESKSLDQKSFDFVHVHQVRAAVLLEMRNLAESANSYEVILKALERPEDFGLTDREHKLLLKNRLTGYEVTGRVLLEAGRVARAIQAFEALSRTQNDSPGDHHLLMARAYFQQDKLEACEQNLNRYFETGRRSGESLALLRDLLEATERSESLTSKLEELADSAEDSMSVRMFLGQILLDQGKTAEAAEVFQGILDSTGEDDAYLGLVRVELANRNANALIATLNRAARSRITIPEMVPLVSSISTVDGFAKDVIKACQDMFQEKPGDLHPAVPYFCSLVAEQLELSEDEAVLLRMSADLKPSPELAIEALDKLGMNHLKQGKFKEAAETFEKMLAMPGLPPVIRVNTLFRISAAYASIEDLDSARTALNEALRIVPSEPQLISRLALVESAAGNLELAEQLLKKSVELLSDAGDVPNVAADANRELIVENRIRLASVYAQLDRWTEAVEQYEAVLGLEALEKETVRLARMGLSNAFVQGGDMEKGEKILEEVYAEDPDDPGVNNDLGYLYADQGKNLEQAEKMIRIAVESQPENPAYLDSLGWVLFRLGRFDEALEPLKKANADPEYQDSTLLEHEGDVHEALKKSDEAKALWQRALDVEEKSTNPDKAIVERLKGKLASPESAEKK